MLVSSPAVVASVGRTMTAVRELTRRSFTVVVVAGDTASETSNTGKMRPSSAAFTPSARSLRWTRSSVYDGGTFRVTLDWSMSGTGRPEQFEPRDVLEAARHFELHPQVPAVDPERALAPLVHV